MQDQVREIKEKTDIVTLIGEHVALKKAGRHWKGLCPFHNEKTPSFTVSPELQMYKCFGCGKAGDVFNFLEEYEGLTFPDALKILAEKAGVKLVKVEGAQSQHKDILFEVNDQAAKFYHYILLNLPLGKIGLEYFTQKRGLSAETIKAFELGVAPDSQYALFDFLTKKKKFAPELLVEAGLIYKTDRGAYVDRFRGRAIFPIQNARGATIALAGRILPGPREKQLAKYINSPETPIYYKSESLFGLPQARADIKKSSVAVVVEGELDMISSWQAGIKNVVAIKGSALTEQHARILSRLAKVIILALDADFAGNSAAMKGIAAASEFGLEVKIAKLGQYKDPDEFARADAAGYKNALASAENVWDFIFDVLFERFSPDTAAGKSLFGKNAAPYLAQIIDPILRAHYVHLVAGRLGVPDEAVLQLVNKQEVVAPVAAAAQPEPLHKDEIGRAMWEEKLIALAARIGPEKLIENEASGYIKTPRAKRLFDFLKQYLQENPNFVLIDFAGALPAELKSGFIEGFIEDSQTTDEREFLSLAKRIIVSDLLAEREELTRKIQALDSRDQVPETTALLAKFGELTKRLAKLQ